MKLSQLSFFFFLLLTLFLLSFKNFENPNSKLTFVVQASTASVSTDTLVLTTNCGDTASGSFIISNAGAANVNYTLKLNQNVPNKVVNMGFETGLGGFINLLPSSIAGRIINSNSAPQGNSYMEVVGTAGLRNGLWKPIKKISPKYVGFWLSTATNSTTDAHGYTGFYHRGVGPNRNSVFSSWIANGQLRINYRDLVNNNPIAALYLTVNNNQWYHVEYKNIDWVNHTADIYVDDILRVAGAGMQNLVSYFDEIYISNPPSFSFTNNGIYGIDDIVTLSDELLNDVTFSPQSGNIGSGLSDTITVNVDASNLQAGVYWLQYVINSNDTCLNEEIVHLKLEVLGDGILNEPNSCLNFDSIFNGYSYQDSVLIWNSGCDTLEFNNVITTHSDLTLINYPSFLAPNDSVFLNVELNPTSVAVYNDTVYLTGPDTVAHICVLANAVNPPIIISDSLSYSIDVVGCFDTVYFPIKFYNNGESDLSWSIDSIVNYTVNDDFEGPSFNTDIWSNWGSGMVRDNSCGSIEGAKSLRFTGSNRLIETHPFDVSNGGTLNFKINITNCSPGIVPSLLAEYSIDNGNTWNNINSYVMRISVTIPVSISIPSGAQTQNTKFRIRQNTNSSSADIWILDDFAIHGSLFNDISATPENGVLMVNDSITVVGKIPVSGFLNGTYNYSALISSNDPTTPVLRIPVQLKIFRIPEINLSTSCLHIDTTKSFESSLDSVLVRNTGCATLTLSSFLTSLPEFNALANPTILHPGDSIYVLVEFKPSTTLGSLQDTLTISSNLGTHMVCLNGVSIGAPDIFVSPTTCVNFNTINSLGVYADSIKIYNNGNGDLNISGMTFSNGVFSTTFNGATVSPGDSVWINIELTTPINSVNLNENFNILNNDSVVIGCLLAKVEFQPISSFTYSLNDPCKGDVNFNNSSTNLPTSTVWDFGDGTQSSLLNPTHAYNQPGMYTVSLISSNSGGSNTTSQNLDLTNILHAEFSAPDSVLVNQTIQFQDKSAGANSWQWQFGDGNSSNSQNPSHSYSNIGVYSVSYTANSASCSENLMRSVVVHAEINLNESHFLDLNLYPVPASDYLWIKWDETGVKNIQILDVSGKKVFNSNKRVFGEYRIQTSSLAPGIYFIRLTTFSGKSAIRKISVGG